MPESAPILDQQIEDGPVSTTISPIELTFLGTRRLIVTDRLAAIDDIAHIRSVIDKQGTN